MYEIKLTTQFRKDYKAARKRGCDISKLEAIIDILASGEKLDKKYKDHPLHGGYTGRRECHIESDWLLMYEIDNEVLVLYLIRTGTNSDLFE